MAGDMYLRMLQLLRGTHAAVPRCPVHGVGIPQIQLGDYVYCARDTAGGDCFERLSHDHVRVRAGRKRRIEGL